jgi:hypothetical protein
MLPDRANDRKPYNKAQALLAATLCGQVKFLLEIAMPYGPVLCVQCDKPEYDCACEKYCTICKSLDNVHLCTDGLYYCPDCREACDVALAESRER